MTTYSHPSPLKYRIQQYAGVAVIITVLLAIPVKLFLATQFPAMLFLLAIPVLLLMIVAVILIMSATPPITLDETGITVQPLIWPSHRIEWDDVVAFKDYPLLPHPQGESDRRLITGKKNYRAPKGKMLVLRQAPFYYRVVGAFAGEGGRPVLAVTNRTHTHYDKLIKQLEKRVKRHS